MDPISAIAAVSAVVGLLDVLTRVSIYLKDVRTASKSIEMYILGFEREIKTLISVDQALEELQCRRTFKVFSLSHLRDVEGVWGAIKSVRDDCMVEVLKLEEILKIIIGKEQSYTRNTANSTKKRLSGHFVDKDVDGFTDDRENDKEDEEKAEYFKFPSLESKAYQKRTGRFQSFTRTLRKQSAEDELAKIRQSLGRYNQALNTLLTALTVIYTQNTHVAVEELGEKMGNNYSELLSHLKYLTSSVGSAKDDSLLQAIDVATNISAKSSFNKHFSAPRSVKSYYTGRKKELDELGSYFNKEQSAGQYPTQKRFVVQGLGGSGKTQFCCQFAQINRQKFWGVFSINGSTPETAKEGFKAIARIGAVDENMHAAKTWLSSLGPEFPWLLIIDNVDDPNFEVDEFFPEGETGFILITTRIYENIKHGTVGQKWFKFAGLETDAAIELLLTCALEREPWTEPTKTVAGTIAKSLGYLPLALVHAATAVSKGICKLVEYMACFQDAMVRLREKTRKNNLTAKSKTLDVYLSVYSSYEVIYAKLEDDKSEEYQDAIELLKIFSFFNRENIRLDVLFAAADVPKLENSTKQSTKLEKKEPSTKASWTILFNELMFGLRTEIFKDRSPPTLPSMLRDVMKLPSENAIGRYKHRLRLALHLLEEWSLASHNVKHDSYSMHPLIHDWVRLRPQMKLGEQAAWSQAAANLLGQSILLPKGGTSSSMDLEMHRSLLLHVIHLRERRKEILDNFNRNVQARLPLRNLLPVITPTLDTVVKDRLQAKQAAQFSYIYFICGHYKEAQELQEAVRDFLVPNLGLTHELSMRISLFLAKTYWLGESRFNDAAALIEKVLEAAKGDWGNEHETTLSAMNELGVFRSFQGRFPDAEDLLQEVVEKRAKVCGPDHQDTLCSIDNLGRVQWALFRFEEARHLHLKAIIGMMKHPEMGPEHEKTLEAKESLAITYNMLGEEYYGEAHTLLEEVVEKRTKTLGRENPWTLGAKSNLALVKYSMGNYTEAEIILRTGLVIADRNLGRSHHGVLAARGRLAKILTALQKYDEAEEMYVEVLDLKNYEGGLRQEGAIKGDQKDRIFMLFQFVEFWEAQKKYNIALKYCEDLCHILKDSVHPIADQSKKKRGILQAVLADEQFSTGIVENAAQNTVLLI